MPRQQLSRSDKSKPETRTRPGQSKPTPKKKKKKITGKRVFWTLFIVAALGVFCALAGYMFIMVSGEKIYQQNINKLAINGPTQIFDRNGTLIQERSVRTGDPVQYDEIPKLLVDAFVATEDRRFFEHQGVDIWSIGRAAVRDVVARSAVEGGSTITQQLAKNVFLNDDKTFFRKATELSIALAIERKMTKEEIITTYLNRIFFGKGAYGIKEASETYFGVTDLNKLKVWQIATLAGLPKAPSRYNPQSNPDLSKERRGVVLQLMADQGYITQAEAKEAAAVDYKYNSSANDKDKNYEAFIEYAMQEAEDVTGLTSDDLNRGGYKIYTTMDAKAQQNLETSFKNNDLFEKSSDDVPVQGSMVIVNNDTAGIVALLGGRNYNTGNFSRVTSRRQPGSAFKPIISYAPALESGKFNPNSLLSNEKQCFGNYCPTNLHGYSSTVTMDEAIQDSINIPAVWTLNQIGIDSGLAFAKSVGFSLTDQDRNLALALGGLSTGTNTLEMAQAYRTFADGGTYTPAYAVKSIVDSGGDEIYKNKADTSQVMSKQTANEMTQMLQDVVNDGTGKRAQINRPVAGKTGTTQHGIEGFRSSANRDAWFVGYTKEWTAAVWMGYDKPDRTHLLNESSGMAAAMFAAVMGPSLEGYPVQQFEAPTPSAPVEQPVEEEPEPEVSAVSGMAASYDKDNQVVALSWKALENASSYTVYRKGSGDGQFTAISSGLSDTSAQDSSAAPGQTYEYYVTATMKDGSQSDASDTVQITVDEATETPAEPEENPEGGVVPPEGEPTTPPTGEEVPGTDNGTGTDQGTGTTPTDPNTDQGTVPPDGGTTTPDGSTDSGQNGTTTPATPDTTTPGTTTDPAAGTTEGTTSPPTTAPPSTP
ncbi:penicillin-binding protein 2A [Paenibacillus sp. SORGH_AS306]|uniref:PBP1A family penicillin-binding protein n=1 Tax=unclassified Paenibacillus TaxID=185978 RepID=UPI00277EDBFA|nr:MULTISPECIES: PBP1A family penicillin-binding protein [unclassified Paenibacillus]MDQ1234528.1 penicillin-binding protein 2A [Paenibacillus sp. SORGH_AS_0306]MDR6111575.1 penicillin-binding protein 2A [Paenibacillus sp. SORGH_AS_0338]